jgi:hypothetical protein
LTDFSAALALEPRHSRALYLRGKALRSAGLLDDAAADMAAAVAAAGMDEFGLPDMVRRSGARGELVAEQGVQIYELCGLLLQQKHGLDEVEPLFMRGTPLMAASASGAVC